MAWDLSVPLCSHWFLPVFYLTEIQQVLENLTELPSSTGAEEIELIFYGESYCEITC